MSRVNGKIQKSDAKNASSPFINIERRFKEIRIDLLINDQIRFYKQNDGFLILVTAGNIKVKIKTYLNNLIQNRLKSILRSRQSRKAIYSYHEVNFFSVLVSMQIQEDLQRQ
jgi:hypothetical protein